MCYSHSPAYESPTRNGDVRPSRRRRLLLSSRARSENRPAGHLQDHRQSRGKVRRAPTPTEAGVAFYERALRAITEADEADAAARGVAASLEGRLRISVAVTFSRIHLVPRLAEFLDSHPRLELGLVMDDRSRDLVAENIDAALRLGALTDSSLRARKLAQSDHLVLASPAYLAGRGTPSGPADLLNHDAIIYSQWTGGRNGPSAADLLKRLYAFTGG